jgi:hypothetical protein
MVALVGKFENAAAWKNGGEILDWMDQGTSWIG